MNTYKEPLSITHPELAAEWHPTKNGGLTPNDVTAGSVKKVWWYLPYDDPTTGRHFDFEWKTTILSRTHGANCPFLTGNAVWEGFNDLATSHPELVKEWHPTKNGTLTPNKIAVYSNKKVWWLLVYDDPKTGKHFDFEWESTTLERIRGCGCPYLSNRAAWKGFNDLATSHPELAKEWHPTKNSSLTPNDVTAGSGKKVWWLLPYDDPNTGKNFDFEWQATVVNRTKGTGCPYLSNRAIWKGFNDLATTHPEIAEQWHPTKNGDLTPNDVTAGSDKKVWWLFPYDDPITGKHFDFEWESTTLERTHGCGCPFLSGKAAWKGFNDLATTHPEIAEQWHPTKNNSLTPNDVTAGSGKKVWWFLPYDDPKTGKHFDFEWQATIADRVNGKGCPYFFGKAVWKGFNDFASAFPELVQQWHPTKNGSLTPSNITAYSSKKVWWYLPYDDPKTGKHFDFEWQARVSSRAEGAGCPFLCGKLVWKGFNDLATTHPELAVEWHPTKNDGLTPSDIVAGTPKKVWWQCLNCRHEWSTTPNNRAAGGNACPLCSSSQGEKEIYNLLKLHSINFIKEYSFPDCKYKSTLRFDFAIFDKNNNLVLLIEYDGEQHTNKKPNYYHKYIPYENCQKRDAVKNQYCKENNIPLLRISYENADRIDEIVTAELKKYKLI